MASSNPTPPLRGLGAHCDQWAAIFLGKSDDVRKGVPAYASPRMHFSARGAIGAHTDADSCLRLRCAGDAPLIVTAATAGTVALIAAVSAAAAPLAVATAVPSTSCSRLRLCTPSRGPDSVPRGRSVRILGVLSFPGTVGVRGWRAGRREAHLCALDLVCVTSPVPLPAIDLGVAETAEQSPGCLHLVIPCGKYCSKPLR